MGDNCLGLWLLAAIYELISPWYFNLVTLGPKSNVTNQMRIMARFRPLGLA